MERNEVVICMALSNFHLEIEWTRVAGEHLVWIEAKISLQEWVF